MLVAQDLFLIKVDDPRVSSVNGLSIDTDYNKYHHTTQTGEIFAESIGVSDQYKYDVPLKKGDTVVFHHFVCQPDHKMSIDTNVYRCEYFHIYAKLENKKIIPVEDIIFVEPILEDESEMFLGNIQIKPHREFLRQQGIVVAASKSANDLGIHAGDKVFFTQNAHYSIKVLDAELWRMRIRNIVAVERDGELICLKSKILIKEIEEENTIKGSFTLEEFVDVRKKSQLKGIVIKKGTAIKDETLEEGSVVAYYAGTNGSLFYKGYNYSFIESRHINFII